MEDCAFATRTTHEKVRRLLFNKCEGLAFNHLTFVNRSRHQHFIHNISCSAVYITSFNLRILHF